VGNDWLSNPGLLSKGQYIEALKLRTNTSGVRVNLIRSGHSTSAMCRNCSLCPETPEHILGQFLSTKSLRIGRHDAVVLKVMDRLMSNHMNIDYHEQNSGASDYSCWTICTVISSMLPSDRRRKGHCRQQRWRKLRSMNRCIP
jgi:hypothetical protein